MELLEEKQVNYEDDINMTLSLIGDDDRYTDAGDRARQWLLHYFNYQRQVWLQITHSYLSVITLTQYNTIM